MIISTVISGPIQVLVAALTSNDWLCIVGSVICIAAWIMLFKLANK